MQAGEGESAGGARVLGDYLGDSGGGDEVAPSAAEDLRAAAVLGGEEGDDGAECKF